MDIEELARGVSGQGRCGTCGAGMISTNGQDKCINCTKPKLPKGYVKPPPVPNTPISEKDLKKVMGDKVNPSPYQSKKQEVKKQPIEVYENKQYSAKDALVIMQNLPMPKDEKEFKKIRKIINLLEKFIGE